MAETRCKARHHLIRVPLLEPAAISCPQIGSAACAAIIEHGEQGSPIDRAMQIQSLFEPTHSKPTKIALQATPGELVPHGEQGRACYAKEPTSTLCAHLPEDGLIPMCADVGGAREALLVQRAATVSLLTEEEWRRMASDATSVRRLNVVALSFLRTI